MTTSVVQPTVAGLTSDQVLAFVLLDLTIIFVVARLVGALLRRIGQPRVVGEILAGLMLGPTLLGPNIFSWGSPPEFLHCESSLEMTGAMPSITGCVFPPQALSVLGVVGHVALIIFTLLVGMELDFTMMRGKARAVGTVAVTALLLPVVLGFAITPLLFNERFAAGFGTTDEPSRVAFALLIGGMLAVTALPVMARILQEKQLTQTRMGSVGIAAAAVVTVGMFLTLGVGAGVARAESVGSIAMRFVGTAAYIGVMFWIVRPALRALGGRYQERGALSGEMLTVVVAVAFASALTAHQLGIHVIVGAFVAGLVVPEPRKALFQEVSSRLSDLVTVLLLPVFLAFSGLQTDFTQLGVAYIGGIALFLGAGVVAKWAGGTVGARLSGLSWAEGNVLGVLMNCRGLTVLVAALVARDTGVITGPMQAGGVLMALLTTAMTGPLLDRFLPRLADATPAPSPYQP